MIRVTGYGLRVLRFGILDFGFRIGKRWTESYESFDFGFVICDF
jgi:hypothetical protein